MNNNLLNKVLNNAGYSNSETLALIINAVPNPTVALEMLLGVHTPISKGAYYKRGDSCLMQIMYVDALRDIVSYTEFEPKTKQVWYKTKQDRDNGVYTDTRPSGDYFDYSWVKTNGVNERKDRTMSIQDLDTRYKECCEEEFFTTIEQWEGKPELEEVTL
jgi:hypothetical protein